MKVVSCWDRVRNWLDIDYTVCLFFLTAGFFKTVLTVISLMSEQMPFQCSDIFFEMSPFEV